MPQTSSELNSQYWEPVATGPVAQADVSTWAPLVPSPTIIASGNYTSALIYADGFKSIAAGVTSTQTGAMTIQRYIDKAGLVAQGTASTVALTASTPAVLNVTDGLPFQSFVLKITNTGGATATITNFACLLNAS